MLWNFKICIFFVKHSILILESILRILGTL